MMNTIFLNPQTWDLAIDAAGNVAMASAPYALAQDASSAMQTFSNEVFYDTSQGVPYFLQVLGQAPSISLVKHYLSTAAMTVPHVASVQVFLQSLKGRVFTGQVQITSDTGATAAIGF